MANSMSFRRTDYETQENERLRRVRRLWHCCALPAFFVLATLVAVTNSAGSATSNSANRKVADVIVAAPSITTQPVGQTVTAGQTATFSVAAAGTSQLSYQWQRNGTAVSGATSSSYITPATTSSDSGALFAVVVSDSAGSTSSNAAILNVAAPAIDGFSIPASHPRLFWNSANLAQAQQWWTGHSYTPNYTNPNPLDPYDTLFACEMTNDPTWCNAQINWAVNLSATNCYQSSGCDAAGGRKRGRRRCLRN